jgi:hypothetical protein
MKKKLEQFLQEFWESKRNVIIEIGIGGCCYIL